MKTELISRDMARAAELIRQGELVAVPTETVYGLAGNGLDETAVKQIYEVKGRPELKPLSLMVPGPEAMPLYCREVPLQAQALARRFWPGPLTIILKARDNVPQIVRAGGDTVGMRCPDHPLTLEALRLAQRPFAAPSANPSGAPSPKCAGDVMNYFDGKIAAVIDGGQCGIGRESTIINMSAAPYKILRQGALAESEIVDALTENLTVIGITGGTGCGKTTALMELEKLGALIIDCDALYHELLQSSDSMIAELKVNFPGAMVNGVLDRKALGRIVFSDNEALLRLNAITHRHVDCALNERLRQHAMAGGRLAAIDAIELISSGVGKKCAATIAVTADRELRIQRIMARDGISREYAAMRVDAQKPDSYFKQNCDYVIKNNSDKAEFTNGFNRIIQEVIGNG